MGYFSSGSMSLRGIQKGCSIRFNYMKSERLTGICSWDNDSGCPANIDDDYLFYFNEYDGVSIWLVPLKDFLDMKQEILIYIEDDHRYEVVCENLKEFTEQEAYASVKNLEKSNKPEIVGLYEMIKRHDNPSQFIDFYVEVFDRCV